MIPLIKPDIEYNDIASSIEKIITSGQLTSGRFVHDFEQSFADYINVKYAVTTTSATTALYITLKGLNVTQGDEILVSDFTFPASGNTIVECGAIPVLIDCQPNSFLLDLNDAKRKITKRTKGIMVVHPFGQVIDRKELERFQSQTGLWVLEDAACAIASTSHNQKAGSIGIAACFSFHPRKVLTTCEGGMITTNDNVLYKTLSRLRNHGAQRHTTGFVFTENGYNFRMNEIQAAMGLSQLQRIDDIIKERKRIGALYLQSELATLVSIPAAEAFDDINLQSFVILLPKHCNRSQIIEELRRKGIESTLGTYAMHAQPAFSRFGYTVGELKNSYHAQEYSLTLPIVKGMAKEDINYIVSTLKECL